MNRGIEMTRYNPNISNRKNWRVGKQDRHCNFVGEDGFKCNHMFTTFDIKIRKCPEHREEEKLSLTKGRNRHHQLGNQQKMFQYEIDMEELDSLSKWKKESDALGSIQTAGAGTTTTLEETKNEFADMIMHLTQEITNHAIIIAKLQKQLESTNKRTISNRQYFYQPPSLVSKIKASIKSEEE